jgi:hypothetical protein
MRILSCRVETLKHPPRDGVMAALDNGLLGENDFLEDPYPTPVRTYEKAGNGQATLRVLDKDLGKLLPIGLTTLNLASANRNVDINALCLAQMRLQTPPQQLDGGYHFLVGLAEPNADDVGVPVDFTHVLDLIVALLDIGLIDAERIDLDHLEKLGSR